MQRHYQITVLERAFQIAKSGSCGTVQDVKTRLVSEGYSIYQITGRALSSQLLALIKAARSDSKGAFRGPTAVSTAATE
jgi:hypothetical protein